MFLERFKTAKEFDPHKHSFNPLEGIDYKRAREFVAVAYGSEGKDTLTVRNGKRALLPLVKNAKRLDLLREVDASGPEFVGLSKEAIAEAYAVVDDILVSPVLQSVFCKRPNFAIRNSNPPSSIVARIDRTNLWRDDALLLGLSLVSLYKGKVIIPDLGFYARDFHDALIREKRLAVGVNSLSELTPKMRQLCMLMEDKSGDRCTYQDADELARYQGLTPHTMGWNDFMKDMMGSGVLVSFT